MAQREYSQEFKLSVVREYLGSPHGIRVIARSFGLPSKNYITRWIDEMLKAQLITEDDIVAASKNHAKTKAKSHIRMKFTLLRPERSSWNKKT